VPTSAGRQTPGLPLTAHEWQASPQALSQQTSSTQKPLVHEAAATHGSPFARGTGVVGASSPPSGPPPPSVPSVPPSPPPGAVARAQEAAARPHNTILGTKALQDTDEGLRINQLFFQPRALDHQASPRSSRDPTNRKRMTSRQSPRG
jgi:hypothetical protein